MIAWVMGDDAPMAACPLSSCLKQFPSTQESFELTTKSKSSYCSCSVCHRTGEQTRISHFFFSSARILSSLHIQMEPPHPSEELQQARNLLNIAWNNGTEKDVRIEEQEAKIQQLERELKQLKETSHSRSPASLLRGRERLREELEAEGANKDPQSRQGSSPGFLMISAVEGEKNQDTSHSTHRERSYFICTDPIRNERDHMDLELGADPQGECAQVAPKG